MITQDKMNNLIEAGWDVIESDFDSDAVLRWRMQAYECLTDLVGPDHSYTRHLKESVTEILSVDEVCRPEQAPLGSAFRAHCLSAAPDERRTSD